MGADSTPASSSTVQHGGFTLSGDGADEALKAIQADEKAKAKGKEDPDPEPEKPKGKAKLSEAASELGKKGGKAAAEARAAKQAETDKALPANTEKDSKETAEPEQKAASEEEDETADLDKHPRAKARVEEKAREAKAAREEAQKERDARIRLEARLEALERSGGRSERQPAQEEAEPPSDEPQLDSYLAKHGAGGETKALSEWVSDRDKWRDGQAQERQNAQRYAERVGKAELNLRTEVKKAMDADETLWPKIQGIASELRASHTLDPRSEMPTAINWLADELHLDPQNAAKVMSHLADDSEDYETIKRYRSPRDVTRAVAIIVAHMEGATAGEPPSGERPASKPAKSMAPPPVRPVTGAPGTASESYGPKDGEDFDQWFRRTKGRKH